MSEQLILEKLCQNTFTVFGFQQSETSNIRRTEKNKAKFTMSKKNKKKTLKCIFHKIKLIPHNIKMSLHCGASSMDYFQFFFCLCLQIGCYGLVVCSLWLFCYIIFIIIIIITMILVTLLLIHQVIDSLFFVCFKMKFSVNIWIGFFFFFGFKICSFELFENCIVDPHKYLVKNPFNIYKIVGIVIRENGKIKTKPWGRWVCLKRRYPVQSQTQQSSCTKLTA